MSGHWKMFPQRNNVWWLWHASPQQLLQYFATFSPEMLLVEERRRGEGRGGGRASQQPLLCRMHAVKLWLFRRGKQKATAPVLNIVSFLSVSFSFYLPLLLCLAVLLPCLYSTLTPLSICVFDKRLAAWAEGGEHPVCRPQQGRAVLAHSKGERGEAGWRWAGGGGLWSAQTFLVRKAERWREQGNICIWRQRNILHSSSANML